MSTRRKHPKHKPTRSERQLVQRLRDLIAVGKLYDTATTMPVIERPR